MLPSDPKDRKGLPIVTGVLDYFPLALAEVAKVSVIGNNQHNPGQPLHWAKEKSTDHADCIGRHLVQRGTIDTDGARHSAKLAWRALANLEIELEQVEKQEPQSDKDCGKIDHYKFKDPCPQCEEGPSAGGGAYNDPANLYSPDIIITAKKALGY